MNPQTDTPESAEAANLRADLLQAEVNRWTKWRDEQPWLAEIVGYQKQLISLTAQQSDTALKLQRCEEALRGMEALATGEGWNTPIFSAPFGAALREARAALALTHPTRNEGEKKV